MLKRPVTAIFRGFGKWLGRIRKELRRSVYRSNFWSWIRLFCVVAFGVLACLAGLFVFFSFSLPSLEKLERIEPSLITRVYDKNGKSVHEFYTQRRIWVPGRKIPEELKQAVFAIEDRTFQEHWGVDLKAYPAALFPALTGGRARGASTLTQQLAKNLFLTSERSIARKVKELMMAVKIERAYTKDEILEFYFNQVYLGAGAYGFAAAADRYFGKPLDSLGVEQYALLAGLLQRPEALRPDRNSEEALVRRSVVLGAMKEEGFLSRAEWKSATEEPLKVREYTARADLGPYFTETVRQFMEKKWNEDFVYNQGASVYTTMDSALQSYADALLPRKLHEIHERQSYTAARAMNMSKHLRVNIDSLVRHWDVYYPRFDSLYLRPDSLPGRRRFPDHLRYRRVQAALIVIDNQTGGVRAMVGGENFTTSKYNRAMQAVRSPGSSFKPFVYAAAVDNGASPGDMVNDEPITIPDPVIPDKFWRPENYEPGFEGPMTLRRAFYKSKNLPAIGTGLKYGLPTIVSYARRFGLLHNVPAVPSLSIGSCEATLIELVSAYTAFPNGGVRTLPYFIERIDDKNGRTVYRNIRQTQEVLRKEAAWILVTMLRDVNTRGTAAAISASGFEHPSGGKTGTTNDFSDAWYIGFTRHYTAGVWVGADDHVSMGKGNTGATDAVPMWLDAMRFAAAGLAPQDFPSPAGVVEAKVCPVSGLLAQGFCGPIEEDYYIGGHQPTESCKPEFHGKKASSVDRSTANSHRDQPTLSGKSDSKKPDRRVRKTF